ncbi:MAG: hypothetical protein HYZ42_11430, partial [Bacteroidetes bacterium]|nr:hypothetical protein [Bacteroidota bacterium]
MIFVYDYTLCLNVPNNIDASSNHVGSQSGKLTLKAIYFKYGNSNKGLYSPYKFEYNSLNPNYNPVGYDRWGNYKNTYKHLDNKEIPAIKYPYNDQRPENRAEANGNSAAWSLTDIRLPSGGKIHIDYESDDYSFVQNKQVMSMIPLCGVGNQGFGNVNIGGNDLFSHDGNNTLLNNNDNNFYIYFKLPIKFNSSAELKDHYLGKNRMPFIYINARLNVLRGMQKKDNYEDYDRVSGYFECENFDFVNNDHNYGCIQLKRVNLQGDLDSKGNESENPISRMAWDHTSKYLMRQFNNKWLDDRADGGSQFQPEDIVRQLGLMVSNLTEVTNFYKKKYQNLKNHDIGRYIIPHESFIRLYNPLVDKDGKAHGKVGGGIRVKKITISDQWKEMSHDPTAPVGPSPTDDVTKEYGQEYDYTMPHRLDGSTDVSISSGVATNEPMVGGDETTLHFPEKYSSNKVALFSGVKDIVYEETPYGETFYPSASVGYSRVTVKDISNNDIKRHATGYTVNEFYTARDFPVI